MFWIRELVLESHNHGLHQKLGDHDDEEGLQKNNETGREHRGSLDKDCTHRDINVETSELAPSRREVWKEHLEG